MIYNAKAPLIDGSESFRNQKFGSKDISRGLPVDVHPYHQKRQKNQYTDDEWSPRIDMGCTLFSYLDLMGNKVHHKTGQWWHPKKGEYERLFDEIVRQGYGSYSEGAYMNAPNKVLDDPNQYVLFTQKHGKKILKVRQDDFFIVANRSYSTEEFAAACMHEIAWGQGFQWGLVTQQARLGFLESGYSPFEIVPNDDPDPIAHAMPAVYYNEKGVALSDSGGDIVADNGVRWIDPLLLRKGFTAIGFTIEII